MNSFNKFQEINKNEIKSCRNCKNLFSVDLVKESPEYNDFGYRYCPFCGTFYDELSDDSGF